MAILLAAVYVSDGVKEGIVIPIELAPFIPPPERCQTSRSMQNRRVQAKQDESIGKEEKLLKQAYRERDEEVEKSIREYALRKRKKGMK